jgi:hypothetical protein
LKQNDSLVRKIIADLRPILSQIVEVLEDQENRLQTIENSNPKAKEELVQIAVTIGKIRDPKEAAAALSEFGVLCRVMGVRVEC